MKQILFSQNKAVLARVPRPAVERGSILVRVHYSLISTGTELAPLIAAQNSQEAQQVVPTLQRLPQLLGKAVRNPGLAAERLKQLSRSYVYSVRQKLVPLPRPERSSGDRPVDLFNAKAAPAGVAWEKGSAREVTASSQGVTVRANGESGVYQAVSQPIAVGRGNWLKLELAGEVTGGEFIVGVLTADRGSWLSNHPLCDGALEHTIVVDPGDQPYVWLVIYLSSAAAKDSGPVVDLNRLMVSSTPADSEAADDMTAIGWNVGYSAAGEVIGVGEGVDGIRIGDFVACGGAGQANHAEFISVKRNLAAVVPRDCPLDLAATTTVGTIALQGVRRTDPKLGETVAVVGLGLLGLITCQLLKANGCRVLGLDLSQSRAERALALGIEAATTDPVRFRDLVNDATGSQGADATIITAATKSSALVNDAMKTTRRKGRVVVVGDIGLEVERADFYRKEIDLLISSSYGPGRYDPAYERDGIDYPYAYVRWTQNRNMQAYLNLVASGRIDVGRLIDERLPLAEAPRGYERLASGADAPVGVLIEYPVAADRSSAGVSEGVRPEPEVVVELRGHRPKRKAPINYVLVGAGAFGTSMLVPQLERCGGRFELLGVVSRDAVRAGNFARQQRLQLLASDLAAVLERPDVELVVIATRHNLHAEQTAEGLLAGRHVFVEKPLALSWPELDRVLDAHAKRPKPVLLMVGFNRRFAPATGILRDRLAGRSAPLVMQYRMNGGYIPPDSWIQGTEGGGRNLGEACHIYDLFRSLAGAPVASISAVPIDPKGTAYLVNDNFVATLTYGDGSLATLTYVANGPKEGLGKERLEVFCEGKAYVLDDFLKLTEFPGNKSLWTAQTADKGHFEELNRFGEAIAAGAEEAPISFDEIVETTAVSLHIEDLLQGRI